MNSWAIYIRALWYQTDQILKISLLRFSSTKFYNKYFTYLNTNLLTHSIEQTPTWEADLFSASQEIPRILWNPKVHYRIHKCPPPVPIPSQIISIHASIPFT